jgi:uracil-xanthine permease
MIGWTLKRGGSVAPDERLPWPQTAALGVQHVFAMFGSTVLAPALMGFDANAAILFSGIGTILFFLVVGGRIPSYLGSSFSFIAVVIAATGYAGHGPNANIAVALGGIFAAGLLYALIGAIVMLAGYGWVERLMPPVVTGAVVAVIGLNLAPVAIRDLGASSFDSAVGLATALATGLVAVYAPGVLRRLPVLLGAVLGYVLFALAANGLGLGRPIDFGPIAAAPWIGLPHFSAPVFHAQAITLIAPVAVVLVAENLGHVKAVAAMTGRDLDPYLGRAFLGDGVATMIAASGGGTGVTTYAENIGVMAVTRIYSTLVFLVAAAVAVLVGFSPKFGALVASIPPAVLGGMSIVLFGLIAATGARIWVENRVDFARSRNLLTAAIALTLGAGDLVLRLAGFGIGGIGTATLAAIVCYQLFRGDDGAAADRPVPGAPFVGTAAADAGAGAHPAPPGAETRSGTARGSDAAL